MSFAQKIWSRLPGLFLLFVNYDRGRGSDAVLACRNGLYTRARTGITAVVPCLRLERPYATACAWMEARPAARLKLSRVQACWFRRISQLPPVYGRCLDDLAAPLYVVRWVAVPGQSRAAERERRFNAARAALQEGKLTRARWTELKASCPAIQRRAPCHRLAKVGLHGRGRHARRRAGAPGGGVSVRLDAIIPAHNEAATVGAVVSALLEADVCRAVTVVDDGSTDATADADRVSRRLRV